jgi:hypothetical protein
VVEFEEIEERLSHNEGHEAVSGDEDLRNA